MRFCTASMSRPPVTDPHLNTTSVVLIIRRQIEDRVHVSIASTLRSVQLVGSFWSKPPLAPLLSFIPVGVVLPDDRHNSGAVVHAHEVRHFLDELTAFETSW